MKSNDQYNVIFKTNRFSVLRMIRAMLPTMRRQGRGIILNFNHEIRSFCIRISGIEPVYAKHQNPCSSPFKIATQLRVARSWAPIELIDAVILKNIRLEI